MSFVVLGNWIFSVAVGLWWTDGVGVVKDTWSRGRLMAVVFVSVDPGGRPEGWSTLVTSPKPHFF